MIRNGVRLLVVAAMVVFSLQAAQPVGLATSVAGKASNFTLVGHTSLFDRGMNSAGAIYDHYMYVGSRTDGSHLHSGVQIVDIGDPTHPTIVGQIPLPLDLSVGYTSRELRVWPEQKMLIVMYFPCSALIHACVSEADVQPLASRFNIFDLTNPAKPVLKASYKPSTEPHEMFLWVDPVHAGRALLFWTSPNNAQKQLVVSDLSNWRSGHVTEVATMATPAFSSISQAMYDTRLHSLSVSPDGTVTYLAYYGQGAMEVDSSDLSSAKPNPQLRLITPIDGRAFWDAESAHSTVKIPGKPYLFSTEEIYGQGLELSAAFGPTFHGCPWGWARVIDASNPLQLHVVSQFMIDENHASFCSQVGTLEQNFSSYTSHNPTVFPDLALVTWHSGGLRAIDLTDPTQPAAAGYFLPAPEPNLVNHTIDPALELGSNGVIAWSYPIVRNGLIYFVDLKNGVYVVRYTGPQAGEVAATTFYEGNSNVGDAMRLSGGVGH